MRSVRLALVVAALVCRTSAAGADAVASAVSERVAFPPRTTSVLKQGALLGPATHDYVVGGAAGQTLTVRLAVKNRFAHFDILDSTTMETLTADPPPRNTTEWAGPLPKTGDYLIRVSLIRPTGFKAAAAYTISIALTGHAAHAATGEVPQTITYVCDNATDLTATYINADPGSARVTIKEKTYTLPHVLSASGAHYSDGTVTFWNKGRDAMFEAPGLTFNCTEK